ncbi:hypothetical protein B0H67DRAFT_596587 [Lasiosphaeris hirsuta]|uniref:Uncharacterized protein n=1 Tax=Lasiosphaeris hirsuta TaxID=260670 RepID=A0AA40BA32_9PEZI|nr:hypothetical protein B0H67DRAFT_596587 [Lasiosphaeris hirsuta]
MMRHLTPNSGHQLCQVCELVSSRRAAPSAKRPFVTLQAGRRLAKMSRDAPNCLIATRLFSTSQPGLKVKRSQVSQELHDTQVGQPIQTTQGSPSKLPQLPGNLDFAELAAAVDRVTKAFLAQPGIPSESVTLTALRACKSGGLTLGPVVQERNSEAADAPGQHETGVSHLLDLDLCAITRNAGKATGPKANSSSPLLPQDLVNKISNAAYEIVAHPDVFITPRVLKEYVDLQVGLGRPESLPQILEMFASKPKPRLVSGSIKYVERNPHRMRNAVDPMVAQTALDAAIKIKNLDVAIGVVESTYAAKATLRFKVVRKALFPLALFGGIPVAAYLTATKLAHLQESMDQATATKVAFAGILAYVAFTATIGMVATTTSNDQMKRVTWSPGTPLKERWLREDERAAFDKVACSFGFSEEHRYGEEQGEEFEVLREFMLRRGMVLDAVELMPGMN